MKKTAQTTSSYCYQSYLIRLWQDGKDAPWRASAKNATTGEHSFFDSPEHLFAFLHTQTKK